MRVNLQNISTSTSSGGGSGNDDVDVGIVHTLFDQMVLILQLTCLTFVSTVVNTSIRTKFVCSARNYRRSKKKRNNNNTCRPNSGEGYELKERKTNFHYLKNRRERERKKRRSNRKNKYIVRW